MLGLCHACYCSDHSDSDRAGSSGAQGSRGSAVLSCYQFLNMAFFLYQICQHWLSCFISLPPFFSWDKTNFLRVESRLEKSASWLCIFVLFLIFCLLINCLLSLVYFIHPIILHSNLCSFRTYIPMASAILFLLF